MKQFTFYKGNLLSFNEDVDLTIDEDDGSAIFGSAIFARIHDELCSEESDLTLDSLP